MVTTNKTNGGVAMTTNNTFTRGVAMTTGSIAAVIRRSFGDVSITRLNNGRYIASTVFLPSDLMFSYTSFEQVLNEWLPDNE